LPGYHWQAYGLNGTDKKNRNHSFVPVIVKAKVVSVFIIVIVFLCFSDEMAAWPPRSD
jgi:hypothetical protein